LLDNKITPLGCEFIGRLMMPKTNSSIMVLKLDHNDIGAAGVRNLAEGLAVNKTLNSLSLTYCNIDKDGARPLFEILIYSQSKLEELILSGNHLRNEGVIIVLRGV
jgi:Ran GTPase-activating protein (RanGAP) involved in mRNA processing and transport